jgi:uncharacterized protein (DUF58 family)
VIDLSRALGGTSPARPGPGPLPVGLVRALELATRRRVDAVMPGDHRAQRSGTGLELERVREYVPGDDVRRIDWNVTARTGQPHVREFVPERHLTTWLVLDVSASMHFGTATRRKRDVAHGVALVLGLLATRRGNRLGIVTFGGPAAVAMPPGTGRRAFGALVDTLRRDDAEEGGGGPGLGRALAQVTASRTRAGIVAIVSDFRGPRDWRAVLQAVAARHEVVAVEISDPREMSLVDVGTLTLVDPETGRMLRVDSGDRRLRATFEREAARERAALAAGLRAFGVRHVVLTTEGQWLPRLVWAMTTRRRT